MSGKYSAISDAKFGDKLFFLIVGNNRYVHGLVLPVYVGLKYDTFIGTAFF